MAGDTFDAGTVYAEARMDRDQFQKDLAELRRDMAAFERQQFTVKPRASTTGLDRDVAGATQTLKGLDKQSANPKVGADNRSFMTKMFDVRAKLKQVSEIIATPLILVEIAQSLIRISQLKYELRDMAKKYVIDVIVLPQAVKEVNKLSNSLLSMTNIARVGLPIVAPLVSAVAGGALAAASSLGAAGGALGIFALGAVPVLTSIVEKSKDIEDAQKKVTEAVTAPQRKAALLDLQQALAAVSKNERQAVQDVNSIKFAWEAFQKSVQPAVFSVLHNSVSLIEKVLRALIPVVNAVAPVINGWIDSLEKGVDSGGLKKFSDWLAGPGAAQLDQWGRAIGNFVAGFANLLMATTGPAVSFSNGLLSMSASFKTWSETIGANPQFQEWMAFTQRVMPDVLFILGQLLPILVELHRIFAPITEAVIGFVAGFMRAHPEITKFLVVGFVLTQFFIGAIALVAGLILKMLLLAVIFGRITAVMAIMRTAGLVWGAVMSGQFALAALHARLLLVQLFRLSAVGRIIGIITTAMRAWAGAQWLLNAAMFANPIGLIIAAIVAVIAIIVLCIVYWDEIVAAVTTAWAWITQKTQEAWAAIKAAIQPALDWMKGAIDSAVKWIVDTWNDVVQFFTDLPGMIGDFFVMIGQAIADGATAAWQWMTSAAETAFNATMDFLAKLPGRIAYGLGWLAGTILKLFVAGWKMMAEGAVIGWNALMDFLVTAPGKILDWANGLADDLNKWGEDVWNGFTDGVKTAWDATMKWFEELPGKIGAFFTDTSTDLNKWGEDTWAGFQGGMETGWDETVKWLEGTPQRVEAAGSWLDDLADTVNAWGERTWAGFTEGLGVAWDATMQWLSEAPDKIGTFFTDADKWLWDVGSDVVAGLWQGIQDGWNGFWGWVGGLIDSFIQGFKDGLGIASPSTVMAEIGGWILEGLLNGMIAFAQMIWGWVTGFGQMLIDGFNFAVDQVVTLWTNFWRGLPIVAQQLFDTVSGIVTSVWNTIVGVFNYSIAVLGAAWNLMWSTLREVADRLFRGIGQTIDTVWTFIKTIFTTAIALLVAGWNVWWTQLQTVATTIFNAIKTVIDVVWAAVKTAFQVAIAFVVAAWNAWWSGLQSVATTIFNAIKSVIDTVWSAVKSAFQTAISFIQSAWSTFWNVLSTTASSIFNGIRSVIDTVLGAVRTAFNTAVDAISTAWGRIREIVAVPIRFMVDTVYNKGIVPAWNWLAKLVGMGQLNTVALAFASGGVLPGYTPGRDTMVASSPYGPVALGGGEAIMRPEFTRAVGKNWVDEANLAARRGGIKGAQRFMQFGGETRMQFAAGGVLAGQTFARAQAGKPYVWGGVGPGGYDCSGFMSAVANAALGLNPYSRRFATGSFGPGKGAGGFVPGTGSAFVIGVSPNTGGGIGHMAGNIGGMGIESRGGDGVVIGGGARSVTSSMFPWQFFLPSAGGQFVNSGGEGGIDLLGELTKLWTKVTDGVSKMASFGGNEWGQAAGGMVKKMADGAWNFLLNKATFGLLGTAPAADVAAPNGVSNSTGGTFDEGGIIPPGRSIVHNNTGRPELAGRLDQWRTLIDSERVRMPQGTAVRTAAETQDLVAQVVAAMRDQAPLVGTMNVPTQEKVSAAEVADEVVFRLKSVRRGGVHSGRPH